MCKYYTYTELKICIGKCNKGINVIKEVERKLSTLSYFMHFNVNCCGFWLIQWFVAFSYLPQKLLYKIVYTILIEMLYRYALKRILFEKALMFRYRDAIFDRSDLENSVLHPNPSLRIYSDKFILHFSLAFYNSKHSTVH